MSEQLTVIVKGAEFASVQEAMNFLKFLGFDVDQAQRADFNPNELVCKGYKKGQQATVDILFGKQDYGGTSDFGVSISAKDGTHFYVDDFDSERTVPHYLRQRNPAYQSKNFLNSLPQWYGAYCAVNALEETGLEPELRWDQATQEVVIEA